jgi:enoyl-CoA hydratase
MGKTFKNMGFEKDDKVATITIDRPGRKNAIDMDTVLELRDLVDRIKQDREILSLILTGSGDEAFISGGDLKYFQMLDSLHKGREMSILCGDLLDSIEGLDIPVIGAINGYAFGGGCEFALACDYRIASKEALLRRRQDLDSDRSTWGL